MVVDGGTVVFEGFEGVRLVADVWGDPDAWPVLFLHGGGQTRHAWGSTAEIVAEGRLAGGGSRPARTRRQ
jgi:pimeloyl-ACP methyl ester carboxylesterase